MTARLESIGRISEKGLDTVREKLLGKDDLSFLKSYFLKLTSHPCSSKLEPKIIFFYE